jgi:hypothetical protein
LDSSCTRRKQVLQEELLRATAAALACSCCAQQAQHLAAFVCSPMHQDRHLTALASMRQQQQVQEWVLRVTAAAFVCSSMQQEWRLAMTARAR